MKSAHIIVSLIHNFVFLFLYFEEKFWVIFSNTCFSANVWSIFVRVTDGEKDENGEESKRVSGLRLSKISQKSP